MFTVLLMAIVVAGCVKTSAPAPALTPTVAVTAAPRTGWEARWEKVLQEARKEGVVYIYGAPIAEVRKGLMEEFEKAYPGIRLDYTSLAGGALIPKVKTEYGAGIRQVDIVISGTTTVLAGVMPFAQPLKPFLIRPEVTDPKAWLGGKLDFADERGESNLVFTFSAWPGIVYNTDLVKKGEIASFWDLANPRYMGKIVMGDPRTSGNSNSQVTFWHEHPDLGPAFIKAFVANKPVIIRDLRLLLESVARGKYSIAAASSYADAAALQKAGVPIAFTDFLKEGTFVSASFGSLAVMDRGPNPNAATVFLNWFLGKEGQTIWATRGNYFSRRLDAPSDHLPKELRGEAQGVSYMPLYHESLIVGKKLALDEYIRKTFEGF